MGKLFQDGDEGKRCWKRVGIYTQWDEGSLRLGVVVVYYYSGYYRRAQSISYRRPGPKVITSRCQGVSGRLFFLVILAHQGRDHRHGCFRASLDG